ncbi:MAG: hypothetical protein NZ959_07520 [Armatimonadetes bacterium]|nr:hypothetical protein [Armatimonadota bacterium]MDW8122212.1 hypothetical protein [Armatimonadota bacterium]
MRRTAGYQQVGWLGLTVQVPSEWDLVVARGNRFDGYLRFDEEAFTRCHIQWTLVSAGKVVLDDQLDRYLEAFERQLKKKGQPVTIRKNTGLVSRKDVGRNVRTFFWECGTVGYGLLWFCQDCRRAVLTQVYGYAHEDLKGTAKRIFLSLSDHQEGDWERWSLYDLSFDAPVGWDLTDSQIQPGKVRFHFRKGPWRITLERWGPASVLLGPEDNLETFVVKVLPQDIKNRFLLHCRSDDFKEHPSLHLKGSDKGAKRPLSVWWRQLTSGQPFPNFLGWLWVCPVSNRIYFVSGILPPAEELVLDHIARSVSCHPEERTDACGR